MRLTLMKISFAITLTLLKKRSKGHCGKKVNLNKYIKRHCANNFIKTVVTAAKLSKLALIKVFYK